jgi:predicted outer membrane repeat protein
MRNLAAAIGTALSMTSQAAVFYVDAGFQGEEPDGSSWLSAYSSLQTAIDQAAQDGGGDIWVKAGVYKPNGNGRTSTFKLHPDTRLYGGFRGNEDSLEQRNPRANRTVLSGDVGKASITSDNTFHVITGASDCSIDGFIVSRGNANSMQDRSKGGGLYLPNGTKNFTLANSTLEKCNAEHGGALFADHAELRITNTTFYSNSAESGGAIATEGTVAIRVENGIFSSNFAPESGGALSLRGGGSTLLINSSFLYNTTDGKGGAVEASYSEDTGSQITVVSNCTFSGNSAQIGGGALAFSGSSAPLLLANEFTKNSSNNGGGAIAGSEGVLIRTSGNVFELNRGLKGEEDWSLADAEKIDVTGNAEMLAFGWTPQAAKAAEKAAAEEAAKPKPKPVRMLEDVYVHTEQNTKVKLRAGVAASEYTVLILGDLTDPAFIRNYRKLEAMAQDFRDRKVGFFYIYRSLAYPENNGYIHPFNLRERARHVELSKRYLATQIPWLCDTMDNETAAALDPGGTNSVFIFRANGEEAYAGPVKKPAALRKALSELVGTADAATPLDAIPLPTIEAVNLPDAALVKRVRPPSSAGPFHAVQMTPAAAQQPYYVKARIEASESLLETGDGQLYLGFHIDPIYPVEWSNTDDPLRYEIKVPAGVVAPSINTAPRVTSKPADTEPREFLLNARKLDPTKPINMQVSYTVRSNVSNKSIEVTQRYIVYLEKDPHGGLAFVRQVSPVTAEEKRQANLDAFSEQLAKNDLDRDGKISRYEATGQLRMQFREVDSDHDGFIDREEFIQHQNK